MYLLMFKQFLRTKTCLFGLIIILVLGFVSIIIGKHFLNNQDKTILQIFEKQEEHIDRNVKIHSDDIGLLLYYLKFSVVNKSKPIAALSIGQKDINPNIVSVKILTLEGQKYDTNLVNPIKLLYGNLDLSFLFIYIFPLLIIAFTYNLYSEEKELGVWKLICTTSKSKLKFLMTKFFVRVVLLLATLILFFILAIFVLRIPWDTSLYIFFIATLVYLLFWFALSFWIISLKKTSNFNALTLLFIWLVLVVLCPAVLNNYITTKYPVHEALTTIIKQRDEYHEKWDTGKRETVQKFYNQYPQFEKYGYPPEQGFNWLWYYAMQNLGDEESREEITSMQNKILLREKISRKWAQLIPSMHVQLVYNDIAGTNLTNHLNFLQYVNDFHEDTRLFFYPKIFSNINAKQVDWTQFKPKYAQLKTETNWSSILTPLLISVFIMLGLTIVNIRRDF